MPFSYIALPIDMADTEQFEKALLVACDLSRQYNAPITVVPLPAHDTQEALPQSEPGGMGEVDRFIAERMARHGVSISAKVMLSRPAGQDFHQALAREIASTGADLVVIAANQEAHGPGQVAQHLMAWTGASIFLVR